mmetsp:Transcript_8495/g.28471  ORF Transcript_8495/g.28471 Transcript_8495/m.28471 type:complete len:402 (-) Transcript_8495:72-1277(-)
MDCCSSQLAGTFVTQQEQAYTVRVVAGDDVNRASLLIDCSTTALKQQTTVCKIVANVRSASESESVAGVATSVSMGGESIYFGNPNAGCEDGDNTGSCGQVCSVTSCQPGFCLLYDWSEQNHLCLNCNDDDDCPGGVQRCAFEQAGVVTIICLGIFSLCFLCCCVCSLNLRFFATNHAPQGSWGFLLALLCCLPLSRFSDQERDERLMGEEEEESDASSDYGEADDLENMKGYIPPSVKEALRMSVLRKGKLSAGAEDQDSTESERERPQEVEREAAAKGGEKAGGSEDVEGKKEQELLEKQQEKEEGKEEEEREETDREGKEDEEAGGRRGATVDPEDPSEEKVDVKLDYFCCKKCARRAIETVLVPCGHRILCRKCAKGVKKCDICQQPVKRVQPVFHV